MRLSLLLASLLLNAACGSGESSFHSVDNDPDMSISSFASLPDEIQALPDSLHVGEPFFEPEPEPPPPLMHLDSARTYIGVVEDPKDSNRGAAVEKFLGCTFGIALIVIESIVCHS